MHTNSDAHAPQYAIIFSLMRLNVDIRLLCRHVDLQCVEYQHKQEHLLRIKCVRKAACENWYQHDRQTRQASQMMESDVVDGIGLEIIGCRALFGLFAPRPREEAIGWNSSLFAENEVMR